MLRRLLTKPLRWGLNLAGRVYVPGPELADALAIAIRLADEGLVSTLGYFQGTGDFPPKVAGETLALIEAIGRRLPGAYASIKAPALGFNPDLLAAVAESAKAGGILLHFDSHERLTRETTLACVEAVAALGVATGLTLPGRWIDSVEDAAWASRLGIRARVVKGEWADPTDPGRDRRKGFLAVVDTLAGRAPAVAVATHDAGLVRESVTRLHAAGTPCEIELLHGLPRREIVEFARKAHVPVRIYVPFGAAWRPYALSKMAENPRMLGWLVRDALRGLRLPNRK